MKQVITATLKLLTTPGQFAAIRSVQLAYRDALNYVSRYAFAHGKMSNQEALQRDRVGEIELEIEVAGLAVAVRPHLTQRFFHVRRNAAHRAEDVPEQQE